VTRTWTTSSRTGASARISNAWPCELLCRNSAAGALPAGRRGDHIGDSTCPCGIPRCADDPPEHLFACARWKAVPMGSSVLVSVQRRLQVRRFLKVFDLVENGPPAAGFRGRNGAATTFGHEAAFLHIGCAFAVESGPGTLGSASREQLQVALFVENRAGGVDPTETDRFFDGFGVWASWSTGGAAPGAQPGAAGRRVVLRQPSPPLVPSLGVEHGVVELPRRGVNRG